MPEIIRLKLHIFDAGHLRVSEWRISLNEWYQKNENEILKELHTQKEGLSSGKASALLQEKGENILEEGKKKSPLKYLQNSLRICW